VARSRSILRFANDGSIRPRRVLKHRAEGETRTVPIHPYLGKLLREHIAEFKPTFVKALVRYNPEGEKALNQRQTSRLKRLGDYLHGKGRSKYMFELLVPAEPAQVERVKGDKKAYDRELRPGLMVQAIQQLQDAGVEADVWKIEGLDRKDDCQKVVAAARRGAGAPCRCAGGLCTTRWAAGMIGVGRLVVGARIARRGTIGVGAGGAATTAWT